MRKFSPTVGRMAHLTDMEVRPGRRRAPGAGHTLKRGSITPPEPNAPGRSPSRLSVRGLFSFRSKPLFACKSCGGPWSGGPELLCSGCGS